jgi:hypothetical protein
LKKYIFRSHISHLRFSVSRLEEIYFVEFNFDPDFIFRLDFISGEILAPPHVGGPNYDLGLDFRLDFISGRSFHLMRRTFTSVLISVLILFQGNFCPHMWGAELRHRS